MSDLTPIHSPHAEVKMHSPSADEGNETKQPTHSNDRQQEVDVCTENDNTPLCNTDPAIQTIHSPSGTTLSARKRTRTPEPADQAVSTPEQNENVRKSSRKRAEPTRLASDKRSAHSADHIYTIDDVKGLKSNRIIVFSGSGISVSSGMSTFSDPGGLYERARRKYSLSEGVRLFHYSFFQKRRADAQAFLSGVWSEARKAKPTSSHKSLAQLAKDGRLVRHYTMNIDGLHYPMGARWDSSKNPTGLTVEMHGNVNEAVCEDCSQVFPMHGRAGNAFKGRRSAVCGAKDCTGLLRPRVMFYDDADEDLITESFDDTLEEDLETADLILWVGISFQQSASVEHFRRVRRCMQAVDRENMLQVLINPSEEPLWNLITALSNVDDLNLKTLLAASDDVMPILAAGNGGSRVRVTRNSKPSCSTP